jgi:hypothetical protein
MAVEAVEAVEAGEAERRGQAASLALAEEINQGLAEDCLQIGLIRLPVENPENRSCCCYHRSYDPKYDFMALICPFEPIPMESS